MSKTNFFVLVAFFLSFSLISLPVMAESMPSSKATARVGNVNIMDSTQLSWSTIMSAKIKTANSKDLFINASLECGLLTRTKVRSKKGESDTSSASASVKVRVLVDGRPAHPGEVTFCKRTQELTAVFGGILEECTDANGDGTITADECEFTEEELELLLSTMNANSFNFIIADLDASVHTIEVQAKIDSAVAFQAGEAAAAASIGRGSVTIEEVRMIKGDQIEF